ncbi:MAG: hypothetical protein K6F84_00010 [Lachnospiraceae bacterium]|nr:hypothetical protein [Lachnospiraceae bacterium]
MLGKLIKHEFKNSYKYLLIYYLFVAVFSVLTIISWKPMMSNPGSAGIIQVLCMLLYCCALFGLGIATVVILCTQFYRTVFGNQGYLTHTLPVKSGAILTSKTFVTLVFSVISIIVLGLSMLFVMSVVTDENIIWEIIQGIGKADWKYLNETIKREFGCNLITMLLIVIALTIICIVHFFTFIWSSMSIGQLMNTKRSLVAVLAGLGLYIAETMIKWGFNASGSNLAAFFLVAEGYTGPVYQQLLRAGGILLLFIVIEMFSTWIIINKRLNLE